MSGALGNWNDLDLATQQQHGRQHKPQQVECERTTPQGRTDLEAPAPPRPSIDNIAEGMWKFAAGQCCQEPWSMLPEDPKAW
jgi:hypothetical protein